MPDINLFKNDKKRFVNEVIWVKGYGKKINKNNATIL